MENGNAQIQCSFRFLWEKTLMKANPSIWFHEREMGFLAPRSLKTGTLGLILKNLGKIWEKLETGMEG
jgi:hypothetical protein